jgi:hypothetical protein
LIYNKNQVMKRVFTLLAAILCTFYIKAQTITYHDVNPDTTVANWEAFQVLNADIWWHPVPEVVVKTWGTTQILCDTHTLPKALNLNDDISANSNGVWSPLDYNCLNCEGTKGNWKGVEDKYLGLRMKNASGNWKYGWIRLDVSANASQFTIKDYAIHTNADVAINAGFTNGTGISQPEKIYGNVKLLVVGNLISVAGFNEKCNLYIIDMNGKILLTKSIKPNEQLDMKAYPAGIYSLYISNEKFSKTFKIAVK